MADKNGKPTPRATALLTSTTEPRDQHDAPAGGGQPEVDEASRPSVAGQASDEGTATDLASTSVGVTAASTASAEVADDSSSSTGSDVDEEPATTQSVDEEPATTQSVPSRQAMPPVQFDSRSAERPPHLGPLQPGWSNGNGQQTAPPRMESEPPEPRTNVGVHPDRMDSAGARRTGVDDPPAKPTTVPTDTSSSRSMPPASRSLRGLVIAVGIGLVLGGALGGLVGTVTAGGAEASALVEIAAAPDPGLSAADGSNAPTTDALADFAANEFATLSSDAFRDDVALKVDSPTAPPVTVTRVGQSTIAQFAAKGATDAEGLKVVQAAVDLYVQSRTDNYEASIKDSIASIDRTLTDLQSPAAVDQRNVTPDPSLQARIDRLLGARADLQLLSNRSGAPVRIVAEPSLPISSGTAPWLLGTILGALGGGLLAIGLTALRRATTRSVQDASAVHDVVGRVLQPVISLPRDWTTSTLRVLPDSDRSTARLLASQVAGTRTMLGRTIAVVSASEASGSRAVATFLAVGAADIAPTVLAEFTDSAHPLASQPGATSVPRTVATDVPGLALTQLYPPAPHQVHQDAAWEQLLELIDAGECCVIVDVGSRLELLRRLPSPVEPVVAVGLEIDNTATVAAITAGLPISGTSAVGIATRLPWNKRVPILRLIGGKRG